MNIGAMENPIFQTSVRDIAKRIKEGNDTTFITTLGNAGQVIAKMSNFAGEYQNFCETVEDFTPVIITKIDFKGKEYLYLEELMFDNGVIKEVEYDTTTVYVEYNVRFVVPEGVYEHILSKGGIGIALN